MTAPEVTYEYGLRLPNGQEVWPPQKFYGIGSQDPEDRAKVLEAIVTSINQMALPLSVTLRGYSWLRRPIEVFPLDDPTLLPVPEVGEEAPVAPAPIPPGQPTTPVDVGPTD